MKFDKKNYKLLFRTFTLLRNKKAVNDYIYCKFLIWNEYTKNKTRYS